MTTPVLICVPRSLSKSKMSKSAMGRTSMSSMSGRTALRCHAAVRLLHPEALDAGVVFAGVHLLHQLEEGHLALAAAEHVDAVGGDDLFRHGGGMVAARDDLGARLALQSPA